MKQQIEKLIELARDYHTFAMEVNLPMTHNRIRGGLQQNPPAWAKEGKLINVYLSDEGRTWQVSFDKVEITNYTKRIGIPFEATEELLQETYNDAYDYLHNYLLVDVAKIKLGVMKEKHKEIKELERKLKKLKGLV
jgi:hypothetical protein